MLAKQIGHGFKPHQGQWLSSVFFCFSFLNFVYIPVRTFSAPVHKLAAGADVIIAFYFHVTILVYSSVCEFLRI